MNFLRILVEMKLAVNNCSKTVRYYLKVRELLASSVLEFVKFRNDIVSQEFGTVFQESEVGNRAIFFSNRKKGGSAIRCWKKKPPYLWSPRRVLLKRFFSSTWDILWRLRFKRAFQISKCVHTQTTPKRISYLKRKEEKIKLCSRNWYGSSRDT